MLTNQYKFSEVTINYDKQRIPLSSMERQNRKGKIRYFGAQGVIDYIDDYIFDGKYLLIAEDGENLKSNKQNIAQVVTGKFWVNNHAHIIQTNDKCDINYLNYYLNSIDLTGYITGSAQPKLNQANLNNILLNLPNLKIQQKIVSILLLLDKKIKLNNATNNNLEQQAIAIFNNDFLHINNGNHFVGDYIKLKRGKNLLSKDAIKGNVPVVAGGLSPSTYHNIANTKAPVITISASGANAGYINLWHIPVWSSDSSFIDNDVTDNVYFWYVLLKQRQKEIYDAQTGSAQPHIYPKHIEALPINNFDNTLATIYNHKVKALFELIGKNLQENIYLSQLRDTLLPKLMSGEIDVSNVDISSDKLSFSEIMLLIHLLHFIFIIYLILCKLKKLSTILSNCILISSNFLFKSKVFTLIWFLPM